MAKGYVLCMTHFTFKILLKEQKYYSKCTLIIKVKAVSAKKM